MKEIKEEQTSWKGADQDLGGLRSGVHLAQPNRYTLTKGPMTQNTPGDGNNNPDQANVDTSSSQRTTRAKRKRTSGMVQVTRKSKWSKNKSLLP